MEYTLQYLKKGCMEDKCFEIFHVWESIFILLSKDGLGEELNLRQEIIFLL